VTPTAVNPRRLRVLLLGIGTLLWFTIGGELVCRFEDDWRIDVFKLETRPAPAAKPSQSDSIAGLTYQEGVDPAWFSAPPAQIHKLPNPELQARTASNPTSMQQENYLWNSALLERPDASQIALIRGFKLATLFAFRSYDGTPYPRYRLYPDNDYQPTPWITNHWGWLSADMTVRKPARTIRVGIIGDSTSHNRYGLYLQGFLDAWAQARGINLRFEVANGGRQGLGFEDGLAVMKYELGPMGLDYVVEYFAPSFSLVLPQMVEFATLPPGVKAGAPPPPEQHPLRESAHRMLAPLAPYSAFVRRLSSDNNGVDSNGLLPEPAKPHVVLHLPSDSAGRIVLEEARKNVYFAQIANHLDHFKALAQTLRATPFVSTERLCVWDGMKLRSGADQGLYQTLNGPLFWPFSYADLQRMLAAHNGTITAWAQANGVNVIDIDGRMPQQPGLCRDAWHDTEFGQRIRAWLIFQAMVPQITHDLSNNLAPHDNSEPSGAHPYLEKPIERIDDAEWLSHITAEVNSTANPAK
jgi:hypothetical protein